MTCVSVQDKRYKLQDSYDNLQPKQLTISTGYYDTKTTTGTQYIVHSTGSTQYIVHTTTVLITMT